MTFPTRPAPKPSQRHPHASASSALSAGTWGFTSATKPKAAKRPTSALRW